jgi:hypothetical protein
MTIASLTDRNVLRAAIALAGLGALLGACSIDRSKTAEQAETKLIGMSRAEIYRCAGLPHREATLGGTQYLTYDNRLTSSNALTLPFVGGGLTQGNDNYCRTTITLDNDKVSSVNYAGATGAFYAGLAQCAYTVEACVKHADEQAKAAAGPGAYEMPEGLRPSYYVPPR